MSRFSQYHDFPYSSSFPRSSSHSKSVIVLLILIGIAFVGWCVFLAGTDMDPTACNGQRITGWSNGRYTNLCVENAP
jgi:hypothetical protein